MKIAQFNTFPYGGAATAAKRLHTQLQANDFDSQFFYHRNQKEPVFDSSFHQLEFESPTFHPITGAFQKRTEKRRQKEVYRQFNDHIAIREPGQETFSMASLPVPTKLNWRTIDADVVHLHWISFFADYPSFFGSIPNDVPIVWTLHDMNAFTGGCHYSNQCASFRFGCGSCNQIANSGPNDVSAATFLVKQKALRFKNIHVVTPSDWMRQLAMNSPIWPDGTSFQTIRLGFDLKEFHPIAKQKAREALGISTDSVLIAFGAEDINNKRKGMHHLLSALTQLHCEKEVECLVFGSGEIEPDDKLPKMHSLGYVDSVAQQALIYSAADLVVVPSREDNQPQVGLEAMACGTPVVGFDAGGIPEYVNDGTTGLIASLGDETQLADRISWLVDNESARQAMGRRARLRMEQDFELGQQTKKYLQLYRNACSVRTSAVA